jgi:2-oxo-4-hydroxy-4-carboxy--5-ureidoimidazoline (OHCU) decarboxylase
LYSDRDTELSTAAGEQLKITHLRLDKLINGTARSGSFQ